MNNPVVSVIIPCYNAVRFLPQTIQSVLSQTFSDFELLIIDDGSTDETEKIVSGFADKRIYYIRKKNTGVADTRNKGIALAKGKYIAFLDADDLWMKNNLEKKINFLEAEKYAAAFSDCIIKDFENNTETFASGCNVNIKRRLLEFIPDTLPVPPSNLILQKEWAKKINGFDISLSTSADWDFAVRLAHLTSFAYVPEPLVIYRYHPYQMHKNIPLMEKDMLYAIRKIKSMNIFESPKYYRKCYSKLALILSGSYFHHTNNFFKTIKYFLHSFFYHPPTLINKFIK